MFEIILKLLIRLNKVKYIEYIHKFLPFISLKTDNNENLWHLGCSYQSMDVIYYAHLYNQDMNQFNNRGLMPIHCLIENSFYEKEKKIIFSLDEKFFDFFMSFSPEINPAWKRVKTDVHIHSRANISGTPLEVLVMLFSKIILNKHRDDYMQYYQNYETIFLKLCKHGANVNFLFEGEDFGKSDVQQDAMQKQNDRIMSHFFCKYISSTQDMYGMYPFFKNTTTDFSLTNEHGDNLIHIFFGRINARNHILDYEKASTIIIDLLSNPNLQEKDLLHRNNFRSTPLNLLKTESYKNLVNSFLLQKKLSQKLPDKEKTKVKKI